MHVRGVDVVHLVPAGRGQCHVGVHGARGHADLKRDQQVELAFGCAFAPGDFLRPQGAFGVEHGAVGPQEMLQEILVSLGACAEQVGAPEKQDPREIGRVVGVFYGKPHLTLLKPRHHVGDDLCIRCCAGFHGLAHKVDRVAVELREGGQPAETGR